MSFQPRHTVLLLIYKIINLQIVIHSSCRTWPWTTDNSLNIAVWSISEWNAICERGTVTKGTGSPKSVRGLVKIGRYGAVEDCWPLLKPPSPTLLDREVENEGEWHKLEHNHSLQIWINCRLISKHTPPPRDIALLCQLLQRSSADDGWTWLIAPNYIWLDKALFTPPSSGWVIKNTNVSQEGKRGILI